MKTIIFIEIQARFTKSFLKKTIDNPSIVKRSRSNEAMKNEVIRIKIVYFGIRTFQNFYVPFWDS